MRRLTMRELRVATRKTPRAINRQIVLNLLRAHQPISRAELARLLGIQRSAVGRIVNELIERGLVREGATGEGGRGRKPTLLHLDSRGRCALAVDVRVTRTYLAVTDLVGRELAPVTSFPTDETPSDFVRHLAHEAHRLLSTHQAVAGRCLGAGVAFPGMLDRSGTIVVHAPALEWRNVPLKEPLAAALGLPVEMENAAKACALAQIWAARGAGPPGDFVFVSVSDGIGVGLVVGGEILRGRHNVAGEYGHVPLSIDGPRCACGAMGCWEAYVSNLATLSRYLGRPLQARPPMSPESRELTVDDVVARSRAGDVKALTALLSTARYLGLGLASIVNSLDPARIYVGGEITAAWDLIEPTVRTGLAERTLAAAAADTEIVVVEAVEHPRLRGASALVGALVFAEEQVA
jgi:predicted NBD/HSP70 family sugar kinase